ncbi:hypothetical protein SAMN05660831_02408 [Thiohalospira halophila DSM 15071]|uniref:Uncharacterized protein n=1 Tax=Thiohalospira halophila DSM 15071 TaxID=1123397 RepID=A0A1I1VIK0_9GAMM|nr:hypothetical protein [Thiohalospira halophila]SFD82872.1 hypothetical protein SAMN05660831_02408 [Thiohalospira halophila DSM 15071]
MNTTKLHIIAKALKKEMARVESVSLINQAVQALQNQINQPQQPNHQQQLSNHLTNLYNRLEGSPVDGFSPAWRDAMEELGVSGEFGKKLEARVRSIFERNQITPQTALEEMKDLHEDLSGTETQLSALVGGLEYFGVGEDKLEINECEVGIVIPRSYVKDNLKGFGLELIEIEKSLLVFSELATGQREPLEIRQISSSELSVFLDYIPEIGASIAIAVERIVALYKQLLEIKKLKKELVSNEVPEDKLAGIEEHAASIVSPKLDELANELMEKFGDHLDSSRRNEVATEVRHSLNKIANRIDRGFNIELRVSEQAQGEEEEETKDADSKEAARQQIRESASSIEYLDQVGEPVLFLPENNDETQK